MKRLKKTLITLVVIITLGFFQTMSPSGTAGAYYSDMRNHWASGVVERWEGHGALSDFEGSRFDPNAYITRAEFFSLLVRALGGTQAENVSRFADLDSSAWYYDIVAIACNMGLASGYDDGLMHPDDNILRQEAVTLLARALGLSSSSTRTLTRYADAYNVSSYAVSYMSALVERGLLSGYPDGTLRPRGNLTRAEAVMLVDNIFPNVYQPESAISGASLQGNLLVTTSGAELRNMTLRGDLIIGDGVGVGSVLLSNCVIEGRVVVRGGGPNSVTLSDTVVHDGIFVASFGPNTRIAVAGSTVIDTVEAISGFTLSGSGVRSVTVLDQAREGVVVDLSGVNLDALDVGGRSSKVRLLLGRVVDTRVSGAGQNAQIEALNNTSIENLTISAPNVRVTGSGTIRSLLVSNTGATIVQKPEFVTVGVNLSAEVAGNNVSGSQATAPNMLDRTDSSSMAVRLLTDTSRHATFDQDSMLSCTVDEGRSAYEVNVTQAVSTQIPLTRTGGRYAYWIGFFIPSPSSRTGSVAVTYTYADGEPTICLKSTTTISGRRGLVVYLPVFRESNQAVGKLNETLYIKWNDGTTENIQFMSTALTLEGLTNSQKMTLQEDFDDGYFRSIDGRTTYSGAEGVRRILSSDNPLGLPSGANLALSVLNRAVTVNEVQDVIEDLVFSADLTLDTSGSSVYARLSEEGKISVAAAVLTAGKNNYSTVAAVKSAFDKAANTRLNAESNLLSAINAAVTPDALRKLIENTGNAALLSFRPASDPYLSYPTSQKNEMAEHLYKLRPYSSIQSVINAIDSYLRANPVKPPAPGDEVVNAVVAAPTSLSFAVGNKRDIKLTVRTSNGTMSAENLEEGAALSWTNGNTSVFADVSLEGDTLTFFAKAVGRDTLTVTVGGKSVKINVTVTAQALATGVKLNLTSTKMLVGDTVKLLPTLTPGNSTDTLRWSSKDPAIATVDADGIVHAVARGTTEIIVETENHITASCTVMVFADTNDVVVDPTSIVLMPGNSFQAQVTTYSPGKTLFWESADPKVAAVSQNGTIFIPFDVVPPKETTVTVRVTGSDNFATVKVTVRPNVGISLRLDRSVMYAGDTQTLYMDVTDNAAIQHQDFYIQVTGGIGGTAAECINVQPVRANDQIQIRARETGVGTATIRVFTNPTFSGEPIGQPMYVTVSPMSVDGVTFDYKYTSGPQFLAQPSAGTITESQYGHYLTMYLANRVDISPMKFLPGSTASRSRLSQPMTWFSYECDFNREVLQDVKTRYVNGTFYILDKNDEILKDNSGNQITFASVFRANEPSSGGTAAEGDIVWQKGYFHFSINTTLRKTVQRDANMKKVASSILSVTSGSVASSSTQHTGLAAVLMTPSRGNLTADQWNEWGSLYYDVVDLFVNGEFNQDIARQTGFVLQEKVGEVWTQSARELYSITEAEVRSGNYRVVDANGALLSGHIPALINGDSNASVNVFYVRLLPDDPTKPSGFSEQVEWVDPESENGQYGHSGITGVTPGSRDSYDFRDANDDLTRPLEYPYLTARVLGESNADPKDAGITMLDSTNYYVFINTPFPTIEPDPLLPNVYKYYFSIEQYSQLGFAPIGTDGAADPGSRQPSILSSTGSPAPIYTLTIISNDPPPEPLPGEDSSADPFTLPEAEATEPTAPPAEPPVAPAEPPVVPAQPPVAPAEPPAAPAVRVGAHMPARDLPGIRSAAQAAEIDLAAAKLVSNTPNLITIDTDGQATLIAAGAAEIAVSSPDDTKTTTATVNIEPVPAVPRSLSLRASATVATGGTLPLLPYFNDPNVDPATLVWTSSNTQVLTVDSNGVVTAVAAGKAKVKLTITGTRLSATCTVTVLAPENGVTSMTINKPSLSVVAGKTATLSVKYDPVKAAGRGVTWYSSDESIARVSPQGVVRGVGGGTVTITAVCDLTGVEATSVVTVTVPVTSVTLSAKTLDMVVGDTSALTYTVNPESATNKSVTWKSSNPKVATVDSEGNISAVAKGTATITVTSVDGKKSASCKVTVTTP